MITIMIRTKSTRQRGVLSPNLIRTLNHNLLPDLTPHPALAHRPSLAAAQMGHDVVMTPNPYTYFDYTYRTTPTVVSADLHGVSQNLCMEVVTAHCGQRARQRPIMIHVADFVTRHGASHKQANAMPPRS
jgi:hypothetical protein